MNEMSMGAMIGFDDFIKDAEKVMKPEVGLNPEEVMVELIEKAESGEADMIGCAMEAEYTKTKKNYNFLFHVMRDDAILILYVGYEEA